MILAALMASAGTHLYYLVDTGNFLNLCGLVLSVIALAAYLSEGA